MAAREKMLLIDEDVAYTSVEGEFTRGGVDITVGTIKNALFSNVSKQNIEDNLNLLLKAQLKKVYQLIGQVYNEEDKDLRLALAYLHQSLLKEIEGE